MQIVIDIPEEEYKKITQGKWEGNSLADYIENGTPLPKGHGRLIDADAIDTRFSDPEVVETLEEAPTIIPAEKEGKA